MKKITKKCFALILAVCTMLSMTMTVFAATKTNSTGGIVSDHPARMVSMGTATAYIENKSIILNSKRNSSSTRWKSDSPNIAYISKTQGAKAIIGLKSTGTTHVYAVTETSTELIVENFTVVVKNKPAVKLNYKSKTVKKGSALSVSIYNLDKPASYKIGNTKIAKVTGVASSITSNTKLSNLSVQMKALKNGKTTLTFTSGGKKYSCTIVVK